MSRIQHLQQTEIHVGRLTKVWYCAGLARQIGELDVASLLSHTLGEEESTDCLLTVLAKPMLQQAWSDDVGEKVNLESASSEPVPGKTSRKNGTPVRSGPARNTAR